MIVTGIIIGIIFLIWGVYVVGSMVNELKLDVRDLEGALSELDDYVEDMTGRVDQLETFG